MDMDMDMHIRTHIWIDNAPSEGAIKHSQRGRKSFCFIDGIALGSGVRPNLKPKL